MNGQNLGGWERALSVAIGLAGVGKGIRRGGVSGWLEVAAAVLVVKRGLTGHCAVKDAFSGRDRSVVAEIHPLPEPSPRRRPARSRASG
ncbi:putative membrane protein [Pseudomonas nitritireducens]|uniref:Putative membrane protein n=1 Tax=Pseudomonas nitroreducens TaxID=46680 RepID=A0A7W7KLD1_PSENT|nr:DUF2892 domain-containing protein [Pseudomonas nitritireducens]MBB4864940.1 putative membrane protein [Pseudomonas nitritireducens]